VSVYKPLPLPMNYSTILRRISSHPKSTILLLRRFVVRHHTVCVRCGVVDEIEIHSTDHQGIRTYRCTACMRTFSELTGTMFFRSKVPLWKWLSALMELAVATGSVSAAEIARKYHLRHATAWRLLLRIRTKLLPRIDPGILRGIVEADEAWFGRKENQDIVCGIVQRAPRKVAFTIVPNVKEATLAPLVQERVEYGSTICTDMRISYASLAVRYTHKTTNHSKGAYGDGAGTHSNTIEQIWGDIKGVIRTIHHGVSKKHRETYLALHAFKVNFQNTTNYFYQLLSCLFTPTYCVI